MATVDNPQVSVILPVYNCERYLAQAIESVLGQTFSDFELIIINDGSKDRSGEVARSFTDPRIRYIEQQNMGLARTLNVGLARARAELIARQDQDDMSLPTRLEHQLRVMRSDKDLGLCATNVRTIDDSGKVVSDPWWPENPLAEVPLEWMLLWENPLAHSSVMLNKKLLLDHGLEYREVSSEDSDLWSRMALKCRLVRIPEALLHYRVLPTSMYNTGKARILSSAIQASIELAATLVGAEISGVPDFHRELTVYPDALGEKPARYRLHEMKAWVERLLRAGRKHWNWDEKAYRLAVDDGQKRLFNYCAMSASPSQFVSSAQILRPDGNLRLARWQARAFLRILKRSVW